MSICRPLKLCLLLFFFPLALLSSAHAEKSEEIETDRPDFTEASSTVGKGVWQLETGYTYNESGRSEASHSYPEALLRVGAFADFFEFRLASNVLSGTSSQSSGIEDLYLGAKISLLEERGLQPELALVLQSDLPTGGRNVTTSQAQPGANLLYGWELNDTFDFGGSSQFNRRLSEFSDPYGEYAQALTVGANFGAGWGMYGEWYAFFPLGKFQGGKAIEQYLNGGPTWKITKDIKLDARFGIGLNGAADNYFSGAGASFRW